MSLENARSVKSLSKRTAVFVVIIALAISVGGVAGASLSIFFGNGNARDAKMKCPGGMSNLSQVLNPDIPVFPGDPQPIVDIIFTVADDGFLVEQVTNGTHAGTHIDVPAHFIEGARALDEIAAEEFVWPAYVIDVRERVAVNGDFQLSWDEIKTYERRNGRIPNGAMVIIQTGFGELFVDDPEAFLTENAPGFSGDAVQQMFDRRYINGVGSDYFGPDATTDDVNFEGTFTTLENDGLVLTNLANLDSLVPRGDLIIAPAIRLEDGSGYQVNPIGCLSRRRR